MSRVAYYLGSALRLEFDIESFSKKINIVTLHSSALLSCVNFHALLSCVNFQASLSSVNFQASLSCVNFLILSKVTYYLGSALQPCWLEFDIESFSKKINIVTLHSSALLSCVNFHALLSCVNFQASLSCVNFQFSSVTFLCEFFNFV